MGNDNSVKTVDELFEQFMTYSKAKNLSERIIGYYEENYECFKGFLDDEGIENINNIDAYVVQVFSLKLREIDNATSINTVYELSGLFCTMS